jgi:acyl carrier protein
MSIDVRIDEMITRFIEQSRGAGIGVAYTDRSALVGDLGFDSLDLVAFLAEIEKSWDLVIPDEDFSLETFATVGAVRRYIKERR